MRHLSACDIACLALNAPFVLGILTSAVVAYIRYRWPLPDEPQPRPALAKHLSWPARLRRWLK